MFWNYINENIVSTWVHSTKKVLVLIKSLDLVLVLGWMSLDLEKDGLEHVTGLHTHDLCRSSYFPSPSKSKHPHPHRWACLELVHVLLIYCYKPLNYYFTVRIKIITYKLKDRIDLDIPSGRIWLTLRHAHVTARVEHALRLRLENDMSKSKFIVEMN